MKNIILSLLLLFICTSSQSQEAYTLGGYGQLYWDWRPDIADSCYEFTFVNYRFTDTFPLQNYVCPTITLYYWDDCNYDRNYINANGLTMTYSNIPLHSNLYATPSSAILDSFCGYPTVYHVKNFAQSKTPHRRRVIYKGLVYLPEKCKNWHFSLGVYYTQCDNSYSCSLITYLIFNQTVNVPYYHNTRSNLDSISYNTFGAQLIDYLPTTNGFYGCSLNNVDFPNNSSPRFLSPPMYSFPYQQEVEFNPGLFDPDHDSLNVRIADTLKELSYFTTGSSPTIPFPIKGFSVVDVNGNPTTDISTLNMYYAPVPGATGPNPQRYTPDNPFDTDSTFKLDHRTGKTTFKTTSLMEPALFYSVKDYRNNTFVSESYCAGQFTILNDTRTPSFIRMDTSTLQGAILLSENKLKVCAGYNISFDAYVKLPNDPSGDLIVRTTADTTVPGNGLCTLIGQHTDSVRLHFTWTPPAGTRGLYNVFVSAKDTNCNPPFHQFMQVFTWDFIVDSCDAPLSVIPIKSNQIEDDFVLFPNPANYKLFIKSNSEFSHVKIYNSVSELVFDKRVKKVKSLDINISSLPDGIYTVSFDEKYSKRLVISR